MKDLWSLLNPTLQYSHTYANNAANRDRQLQDLQISRDGAQGSAEIEIENLRSDPADFDRWIRFFASSKMDSYCIEGDRE